MSFKRSGPVSRVCAPQPKTSGWRTAGRLALGAALVGAGVTHLTVARDEFAAQVPESVPLDTDTVVVASGVVEIGLGAALLLLAKRRVPVGLTVALFFIAIFPGNIAQWVHGRDAFGLDTDAKRGVRLLFQPLLVAWALWATAAWRDRPWGARKN